MKVLVGFLMSPEGRVALEHAIAETKQRGGSLVIVHSMRGSERDEVESTVAHREELEAISERLSKEGVDHTVRDLVRGKSPADDVLDVAHEEGADLVVIGIRRRSPVGKLVLGSNAQAILLRARCPVLAVKPEGPD